MEVISVSLYYNNFRYLDENSIDKGLMVVSFEPDNGFTDSFLSMDSIQDEYYDGSKKFDYGAKYNAPAVINVTVIKRNGTDFTLSEVRELSKWLTGSRVNSWLDIGPTRFEKGKDDDENIKYSFLCKVTNLQPYKLDGRTSGFKIEFTSVSPWAYSTPQRFELTIGENMLYMVDPSTVTRGNDTAPSINVDENGVLYNSPSEVNSYFLIENDIVYVDNSARTYIDNQSDDLYTYIGLDIDYINETGTNVSIKNETLNEETKIENMTDKEIIKLSAQQFIVSYTIDKLTGQRVLNENKIFGDDFNFVWPRLTPGVNNFIVNGAAKGSVQFSYRYPMKVGDCAMDISVYGNEISCGDCESGAPYDTVKWENIINTPTTIEGYGITDAYTDDEIDDMIDDIEISGGTGGSINTNINEKELNDMLADILK